MFRIIFIFVVFNLSSFAENKELFKKKALLNFTIAMQDCVFTKVTVDGASDGINTSKYKIYIDRVNRALNVLVENGFFTEVNIKIKSPWLLSKDLENKLKKIMDGHIDSLGKEFGYASAYMMMDTWHRPQDDPGNQQQKTIILKIRVPSKKLNAIVESFSDFKIK